MGTWRLSAFLASRCQFYQIREHNICESVISSGERPLFQGESGPEKKKVTELFRDNKYDEIEDLVNENPTLLVDFHSDPETLVYYNNAIARAKALTLTKIKIGRGLTDQKQFNNF